MHPSQPIITHLDSTPTDAYFLSFQKGYKEAPLLVYLPGLDETGADLISLQTASFQQDFNVRSLVIPPDDLDDWDELAASAIALTQHELAAMPDRLPVYLCGESFGGCLALKVLSIEADLFDRIVLVNPASSFRRVPWLNLGSQLFPLVPEFFYELSEKFAIVDFLAPPERLSPAAKRSLLASTRAAPKETLQRRLDLMREFLVDDAALRKIRCPVLLIGAQADRILPSVQEAHRLAKIFPHVQVVTLPHSGHACLVETGVNLDEIMRSRDFVSPARLPA